MKLTTNLHVVTCYKRFVFTLHAPACLHVMTFRPRGNYAIYKLGLSLTCRKAWIQPTH